MQLLSVCFLSIHVVTCSLTQPFFYTSFFCNKTANFAVYILQKRSSGSIRLHNQCHQRRLKHQTLSSHVYSEDGKSRGRDKGWRTAWYQNLKQPEKERRVRWVDEVETKEEEGPKEKKEEENMNACIADKGNSIYANVSSVKVRRWNRRWSTRDLPSLNEFAVSLLSWNRTVSSLCSVCGVNFTTRRGSCACQLCMVLLISSIVEYTHFTLKMDIHAKNIEEEKDVSVEWLFIHCPLSMMIPSFIPLSDSHLSNNVAFSVQQKLYHNCLACKIEGWKREENHSNAYTSIHFGVKGYTSQVCGCIIILHETNALTCIIKKRWLRGLIFKMREDSLLLSSQSILLLV